MWGTGFFKGLWVTFKNALRGPVTLNYPDERWELPERARWAVALLYDEEGAMLCTACTNCVRECPDDVLVLDVETDEDKNKRIVRFTYEVGACMFCGLCVEKCPFAALEMSDDYELATTDTAELTVMLAEDVMAASPKRKKKEKSAERSPDKPAGDSDKPAGDTDKPAGDTDKPAHEPAAGAVADTEGGEADE